jgi:hypothetical protein
VIVQGGAITFDGEITLELRKGAYTFDMMSGPEFQTRQGHFTIDRHAEDAKQIDFSRIVDMQREGWWAGDLDVQYPLEQMRLLMEAEHVDFAPVLTHENIQGKCKAFRDRSRQLLGLGAGSEMASEMTTPLFGRWSVLDRRRGGGLLFFGEAVPESVCDMRQQGPSLLCMGDGVQAKGHRVALTPFAWDLPVWLASGNLDAIGLIHRHSLAGETVDNEAWGMKRDRAFFPGKLGNGRWSEAIYHHVLECGLHVPPAAGSGAGSVNTFLGANRAHVHCGKTFSHDEWWQGLCAGKVIVTNGPLLRVQVEGQPPGACFSVAEGESRDFQIGLNLSFYSKSPVEYLEIIKNGQVEYQVRLDQLAKKKGRLPELSFAESGWFLVRAMTINSKVYQYASTGPYYVEVDSSRRISRKSVQFFRAWLDQASEKFQGNEPVQKQIAEARPFWLNLLEQANTE